MVVANLKNCEKYESLHKDFKKVFDYLKSVAAEYEKGKVVLDEGNVWINLQVVEEDAGKGAVYEAHRDFIDIQYIFKGEEKFGYADVETLTVSKEYNEEKDVFFLEGEGSVMTLRAGDFCIVFPEDAHAPKMEKLSEGTLYRIVAKVRI